MRFTSAILDIFGFPVIERDPGPFPRRWRATGVLPKYFLPNVQPYCIFTRCKRTIIDWCLSRIDLVFSEITLRRWLLALTFANKMCTPTDLALAKLNFSVFGIAVSRVNFCDKQCPLPTNGLEGRKSNSGA